MKEHNFIMTSPIDKRDLLPRTVFVIRPHTSFGCSITSQHQLIQFIRDTNLVVTYTGTNIHDIIDHIFC